MHQEQFEWAETPNGQAGPGTKREELRGEVVFASEEEQNQRSTELLGAGALLVVVPRPQPHVRGRLGEVIEELVERELARMGAPSPYLAAWSAMPEDAQARLADQLFRARTVGASGLAIALGRLSAIAAPMLTPDDSATLRWLADATENAPLVVLIDDSDLMLPAYAAPVPLGSLLSTRQPAWDSAPSSLEPVALEVDETTMDDSIVVASIEIADAILDASTEDCDASTGDSDASSEDCDASAESATSSEIEAAGLSDAEAEVIDADASEHLPEVSPADAAELPQVVVDTVLAQPAQPAAAVVEENAPAPHQRRSDRRVSAGFSTSGPGDAWRSWAIALSSARGPQPLAAFERLFTESYVPLSNAIATGLDDPRALRAYDDFRRSFERSYSDAFATFGATNRRPRLVMDAYDIASKQARLSNARATHVLIVDSMRFDLGCLVRDAIAREAAGVATLSSEVLLWSALPSTTMRQIETLARGLDALRAPAREEPAESLRGRAAEIVRRLRVGSRELYKLDVIPSMLEATPDVVGSLEAIAVHAAEAIARHVSTLPPRTLLFVVGDHGFSVDRRGEIRTGGASPEEVLVPGFSWLVGDLH